MDRGGGMNLESHWLDTAPAFGGGATGHVEGRVNAAPIGGGAS
jgi:hypothetical protein